MKKFLQETTKFNMWIRTNVLKMTTELVSPESQLSFKNREKKKDNATKKPNLTSHLLNIYQMAALSDSLYAGVSRLAAWEMGQLVSAISFGVL